MQAEIDALKADLTKAKSTVKALQSLRGRKVAVTGSLRGCGPAIVKRLLQDGASVVAADHGMSDELAVAVGLRSPQVEGEGEGEGEGESKTTPEEEAIAAGRLVFYDMGAEETEEDGAAMLAETCKESFGGMDGLVCNTAAGAPAPTQAGVQGATGNAEAMETWDPVAWAATLAGTLTEPMLAVKYALPLLKAACSSGTVGAGGGGGAIVNVAWNVSHGLAKQQGGETLAAAGGGLVALTNALAVSSGPHVRVNAVSVPVGTGEMGGGGGAQASSALARRAGSGKDAASAVAFLLSSRAGFVTGQNLVVDGGLSSRTMN